MTETIGVIGGGIVGIAIAREIGQRGLGPVVVFEKERRVAAHQSGHNSGVVHAGLYYAPGSLKAALCAAGRIATRDYCLERGLPYREVGKIVVATDESELPALDRIEERSRINSVPDLRRLSSEELLEIEPHAAGVAALHSPRTAVVDYSAITEALADDVRQAGGDIRLGTRVTGIAREPERIRVSTTTGDFVVDKLIACAGLQSDEVAAMAGADPSPRILPFRGEYWSMTPESSALVRGMIYPVPDPSFPFLGVHFTRGVYDDVHVGPNAVPALAREGYRWRAVSPKDTWGSLRWPGAMPLARKHWRMGAREIAASVLKPLYFAQARRFIPELTQKDLEKKTAAGVRAQAWAADGSLVDDFAVDRLERIMLLRNAPSPAATSAMAIAGYVLDHYFA